MNSKLLLSLCLISLASATLTIDSSKHCECSELNQADCVTQGSYCVWNSSSCQSYTFSCSSLAQAACQAVVNSCKWSNNSCQSGGYSCSDMTTAATCGTVSNCYYNKNNTCASFSTCGDYTTDNCPYSQGCTVTSGACAAVVYANCSNLSGANCTGAASATSYCTLNNSNTCASISNSATCSDLANFTTVCQSYSSYCTWANNTCRTKTCGDITTQSSCTRVRTYGGTTATLCSWNSSTSACAEATDVSTAYTADTCNSATYNNYKWTSDSKCVACSSLIDENSNALLLGGLIIMALFA